MNREHKDLDNVINSVHDKMRAAKTKLKNTTILREITTLSSVLHNTTRWTGN